MRIGRRAAALWLVASGAAAQGLTPAQRAEVLEVLRDALRNDPSLWREAQAAAAAAEERARAAGQAATIRAQAAALFDDPEDAVLGNPAGSRAIVEFADPRCGFCKQFHPTRQAALRRHPAVRVVMKDLAILGPASVQAARALLAAQRQGRYAALHDALYRLREEPTEGVLQREAQRAGCDWARLRREMEDPAIERRLRRNLTLAQAVGVEGTPALIVGDRLVAGAVGAAELEALLGGAG